MKLFDILSLGKGFDCCDNTFDYTIYFDEIDTTTKENEKDNYDKFCEYVAKHVDAVCFGTNNISHTDILFVDFIGFINNNIKAFEKFADENCSISPNDYDAKEDKMFACLQILEDMTNGNYTETQYIEIINLLNKYNKGV